jgi:hypothetical protein
MVHGSPWAFWPVFLGLSLAVFLVTAGLVFAVQNLKEQQGWDETATVDIAEIPPPYSPITEKANDLRQRNLPIEATAKQEVSIPITTAKAKAILTLPLVAAKKAPELVPPLAQKEAIAKTLPITEKNLLDKLTPATSSCATKLPEVCSTNVLDAATNDPTYGTAIHFVSSPAIASGDALKQDKLVFVLHVSGNFEDPQFT